MFGLLMFGGIVANDSLVYIWKDNFVWPSNVAQIWRKSLHLQG